jgi:hypothetical protein
MPHCIPPQSEIRRDQRNSILQAGDYPAGVRQQADNWNGPIVEAPKGRRDEFVEPSSGERERVYAPLSAARLHPARGDASLPPDKHTLLDRLYRRPNTSLDRLLGAVGLASSPSINENKILIDAP